MESPMSFDEDDAAYDEEQLAALVITRFFRRLVTRSIAHRARLDAASGRLARWWRYWHSVTPRTWHELVAAEAELWTRNEAALRVQRVFRGYLSRRPYRQADAREVASTLQRIGRGFVARWWCCYTRPPSPLASLRSGDPNIESTSFRRRKDSQVLVPVGYRAAADASEFVMRLRNLKTRTRLNSALLLQQWWRAVAAKLARARHRRTMDRLLFLNRQAITLQRWWRRLLRRRAIAAIPPGKKRQQAIEAQKELDAAAVDSEYVVRHEIHACERGSSRRATHRQLLEIWDAATATSGPMALHGRDDSANVALQATVAAHSRRGQHQHAKTPTPRAAGLLPPLQSSNARQSRGASRQKKPTVQHRKAPASTYTSRLNPETPQGRYAPLTNNGRQIWNSSGRSGLPSWVCEERDPELYKRPTSSFMYS